MDKAIFDRFREIVYARSGISLNESKEALVSARVAKRMRALGVGSHTEYLKRVMDDAEDREMVHLIDAISTNVTSFFREPAHFDFLAARLREWVAKGQKRIRIWSAACSSGEEPYTLAMTVLEAIGSRDVDVKILATDISTSVLERAQAGHYPAEKLAPVPAPLRERYFRRERDENGQIYVATPALKELIAFRRINLSSPPFPMRGPMDAVFCRNVMIYFDNTVRKGLLREIERLLKPGGFLMVGHAESLTGLVSAFKTIRPSIYLK